MKTVTLSQGKVAFVDDDDFEYVSKFKWSYKRNEDGQEYAYRTIRTGERPTTVTMHRELMGNPKCYVDHRDGYGLNNSRSNLRYSTPSQNSYNSKISKKNKSGFIGVWWDSKRDRWRVKISHDKKEEHVGYFTDKESAAKARDVAAMKYHGEFAKFNFPQITTSESQ